MDNNFTAKIERFDMQGAWHFVNVPVEVSGPFKPLAIHFGFVSILAKVGGTEWETSLLPMGDGTYIIALPAKVRAKEGLSAGDEIEVAFKPWVKTRKNKLT